MPTIEACYLYPVKGLTPVEAPHLDLEVGRSPRGDRAFMFAFADGEQHGDIQWVSKHQAVTLVNTPHLASLRSAYDSDARTLTITTPDGDEMSAAIDDAAARVSLAAWLAERVRRMPDNPLSGRTEREPLLLLGEGDSRYTDRGPTQVSFASVESLADLSQRAGRPVDALRFRGNLMISGVEPWQEFEWAGRRLRFGDAVLEVTAPLKRCAAVNAEPRGAGRDLDLTALLQREYGHIDFGVEANVISAGRVRPGDTIELVS